MTADAHEDPAPIAAPMRESAFDFLERDHRRRVRQKWIILLAGPPLFAVVVLIVLALLPPTYEATGRVRLGAGLGGVAGDGNFSKRDFRDEIALLSAQQFKRNVLEELSPEDRAKLISQQRGPRYAAKHVKDSAAAPGLALRTGVLITGDIDSALLSISDKNRDPELAAALTNAAIRAIEHSGTQIALARSRTVQSFFAPRIAELDDLIREEQQQEQTVSEDAAGEAEVTSARKPSAATGAPVAQNQFEDRIVRKHNLKQGNDQRQAITFGKLPDETVLTVIQKAATQATLNARLEEARLKLLRSFQADDPGAFDRLTHDTVLITLQQSLGAAQATYNQMASTLGQNNPRMVERTANLSALRQEIAALRQSRVHAAQFSVTQARQHAAALNAQLSTERRNLERILAAQQSSAILEINLAVNLTLLADLHQKLDEYTLDAALNAPLVQIVDPALTPAEPSRFPLFRGFVFASAAGLFLAAFAIGGLQLRERRRWSIFSLEHAAGRPVLALLKQVAPRTAATDLAPELADPLREVRSALALFRGPRPSMTCVLTSSRGGEGTTTLVTALALLLARSGERVLLLDANLYRPALHRQLDLPGRIGLSQTLTGGATLEQAIQHIAVEGTGQLDVITAGPMPPIPSELLQSFAFDELLRHARSRYSYVLLDSAPAGAPLAMLSMAQVDAVFLTVRYNMVDLRQVRYTERQLLRAPFRALLVNGIPQGRLRTAPTQP